jgi:hypothetical protein
MALINIGFLRSFVFRFSKKHLVFGAIFRFFGFLTKEWDLPTLAGAIIIQSPETRSCRN